MNGKSYSNQPAACSKARVISIKDFRRIIKVSVKVI